MGQPGRRGRAGRCRHRAGGAVGGGPPRAGRRRRGRRGRGRRRRRLRALPLGDRPPPLPDPRVGRRRGRRRGMAGHDHADRYGPLPRRRRGRRAGLHVPAGVAGVAPDRRPPPAAGRRRRLRRLRRPHHDGGDGRRLRALAAVPGAGRPDAGRLRPAVAAAARLGRAADRRGRWLRDRGGADPVRRAGCAQGRLPVLAHLEPAGRQRAAGQRRLRLGSGLPPVHLAEEEDRGFRGHVAAADVLEGGRPHRVRERPLAGALGGAAGIQRRHQVGGRAGRAAAAVRRPGLQGP